VGRGNGPTATALWLGHPDERPPVVAGVRLLLTGGGTRSRSVEGFSDRGLTPLGGMAAKEYAFYAMLLNSYKNPQKRWFLSGYYGKPKRAILYRGESIYLGAPSNSSSVSLPVAAILIP